MDEKKLGELHPSQIFTITKYLLTQLSKSPVKRSKSQHNRMNEQLEVLVPACRNI